MIHNTSKQAVLRFDWFQTNSRYLIYLRLRWIGTQGLIPRWELKDIERSPKSRFQRAPLLLWLSISSLTWSSSLLRLADPRWYNFLGFCLQSYRAAWHMYSQHLPSFSEGKLIPQFLFFAKSSFASGSPETQKVDKLDRFSFQKSQHSKLEVFCSFLNMY